MNLSGLILRVRSNRKRIKNFVVNSFGIFIGSLVYAISINIFIQPNKIAPGGFIGIAIIINHFFPVIKIGLFIIAMNIPLFLIGTKRMGLKFLLGSIIGTILSSVLIDLTLPYLPAIKIDPMLAAIYGGFLMGAGIGIIFRSYASTGGTDLLAQIVYDYTGLPFGQALMIIDIAIIILAGIVFKNINIPLYSIIAELVSNFSIDLAQEGFIFYRTLNIITLKPDLIANGIFGELGRGVTEIKVKGSYTKEERTMLIVAVPHTEVSKAKKVILSIDPQCFIIVGDASEIIGQGFKSPEERI